MSFPRYPNYKDSGVEWLGKVPAHWCVGSLRWLTRRYSGGTPDKTNLAYWEDGTIPWLNSGAVNDRVIKEPSTYITADAFSNSSAKWIPEGSLVMALAGQGKTKGMVAQLTIPSTCNQSMAAIIPGSEIAGPFLFWWLDSNYQNIRNMAGGDLRDGLNLELLGNIQCPLPTPAEQTRIAAFLDRETARIDDLVAEQRRLMELLKEKRQAVISHAVTQGLNPNAPMKASGFEWLGDVPVHWEVAPLKHLCVLLKDGTHLPPERVDEGIPLLSVRNLVDGEFVLREDDSMISEESYQDLSRAFVPKAGDVLLAIVGATLGKTAVISSGLGPFHIQRSVAIFRTRPDVLHSGFLNLVFQSSSFQALLWELVGYSAQPGIYLGTLQNIRIPVPTFGEQTRILESISSAANELTSLTAEAQRAIDLLQERRSALISAAVTGQIDVRHLAEKQAA